MENLSVMDYKLAHKTICDFKYKVKPVWRGYAGRTLYINLDTNDIAEKPVSDEMIKTFTGGRGFCLKLLWDGVKDNTKWNDSENELLIASGPIGGISSYPGSGKSTVVTISPLTNVVIDSNSGGYFGPYLKFSGWDALEVQGKAKEDVIIFIDGDKGIVQIETAPLESPNTHIINRILTEMYAESAENMRNISVVSAGQAAEHVLMCGLNISYYDPKRDEVRIKQAARGGAGTVLRNKKIKAIVVKYSSMNPNSNNVADMALIRKAGVRINKEIVTFDPSQNDMRGTGTPYLVEIMNKFDLLPVQNFRFGSDEQAYKIAGDIWKEKFDRRGTDGCWYGCTMSCAHGIPHFHLKTGPYKDQPVFVDGPEYETLGALGSNIALYDPEALLELNFYADTYGVDTISLGNSFAFVMECYEAGILDKEKTGGLDFTWGNSDACLKALHQMAEGEGFGVTIGQGIRAMKQIFEEKFGGDASFLHDIGMEVKGLEISEYMTKESLTQQGGYALASKGAQHDEAWLIFMELVHKQLPTFEKKAEALHYFPMWRTWFSLHGLCKLPWNDIIPESNKTASEPSKVPEHVENYTWLYEGVTGIKVTPEELVLQSEKVYMFQRLFNLRLGYGKRSEDYPPYRAVGPVTEVEYESRVERYDTELKEAIGIETDGLKTTEKMKLLRTYRENRYEQLLDAVYLRRGWTKDGVPTLDSAIRLGIDFEDVVILINKNT